MPRILSSYEYKRLAKYSMEDVDLAQYGEMPVEYICGYGEFCGREFKVSGQVLIPRVETEEIIELIMKQIEIKGLGSLQIADIGCGSGCIGITLAVELAKRRPEVDCQIWLSDISDDALLVANYNAQQLLDDTTYAKLHFLKSDLLNQFPQNILFDVMVANLPYIPSSRIPTLDPSVKDFEPLVALDGGENGLGIIRKLFSAANDMLHPSGFIVLEVDETHVPDQLNGTLDADWQINVLKDDFGKNRFWVIKKAASIR